MRNMIKEPGIFVKYRVFIREDSKKEWIFSTFGNLQEYNTSAQNAEKIDRLLSNITKSAYERKKRPSVFFTQRV